MLVLKRKEGQWVEIHHRSGDVIRMRVYGICGGAPGRVNIAFDDAPRHFEIRRPERRGDEKENSVAEITNPVVIPQPILAADAATLGAAFV